MLKTEKFEVTISPNNIKRYKSFGYDVKYRDVIFVNKEEISRGSHAKEVRICDNCGKEYTKAHRDMEITYERFKQDLCPECSAKKRREKAEKTCLEKFGFHTPLESKEIQAKIEATNLQLYGVKRPMESEFIRNKGQQSFQEHFQGAKMLTQVFELQEKAKNTIRERYGVENVAQSEEIKEKIKQTCIQKYGKENPSQVVEIRAKIEESFYEKFGVVNAMQIPENVEKASQTCYANYGVYHPLQNPDILSKMIDTFNRNGTCKTSVPQEELYSKCKDLFSDCEVYINYPFKYYTLDIMIIKNDIKIDIEYDGWYWHKNNKRDKARDSYVANRGVKILRVKSGSLLPKDEELIGAVQLLLTTEKNKSEIVLSDWKD